MKEISDKKLREKCNSIYDEILELKKLNVDEYYCAYQLDWFEEVLKKNIAIQKSIETGKNHEKYRKYRQHVYWINFGRGIGSEYRDYHYAVVLYESETSAVVVPLTSKKEEEPEWVKRNRRGLVDLGEIDGFPEENKEAYACVFMMQSVSKKRLDRCGNKAEGYFDIAITDDQMEKISNKVVEIANNCVDVIDKNSQV